MKKRLDIIMVEKGLVTGRDRAKGYIMAGQVFVDNQQATKCGMPVDEQSKVELRTSELKYVSRGGLKLEKAMEVFPINLDSKTCLDIGASTGGFTDCMLQNGAAKVYAVDVGYGQLAWKLRCDERVVVMERTNFRYVTTEQISQPVDFASVDVSFISLRLILPAAYNLLCENGEMVCLIKPQFEAGRDKVGKRGVVQDSQVHIDVIEEVTKFTKEAGFSLMGLDYSPVRGPEGNIEYLLYIKKSSDDNIAVNSELITQVVENSHNEL